MLKRGIFERFFIHFFILLALSIFVRAQSSSATLTTFKASALIGENLNVSWYVSGVTNANDYIALVPTGKPFSSGYPFVLTKGARTGNKSLTVPANVQSVQFMYYSAAAKKEIGRSAAIAVSSSTVTLQPSKNIVLIGEALQVTWVVSGITNTYDYIALVPTGKPFSSGYPFVLTKGARTGNKSLTVPANVQSVQFMYYSAAAKKEIGRSVNLTVSVSSAALTPQAGVPTERISVPVLLNTTSSMVSTIERKLEQDISRGYIIELTEEPVAQKEKRLRDTAKENKEKISSMNKLNPVKYVYKAFATTSDKIPGELKKHRGRVKDEQKNAKELIKKRLGKTAINNLITGNAIAVDGRLNVLNEYQNVFNGLLLAINESEAEKLKVLSAIKSVHPNREVKALLMDSVPLINADDVWKLDKDGNQCADSGKECLTGKGVTIGIIDTGVDYTHADLGGCFGSGCKVIGGYDFVTCEELDKTSGGCLSPKNEDNDPMDEHGHGTHVAATAAGNGVLKGVAPDAKIYAYRVLNREGQGTFGWVIASIERAVDPNQDGNFSDHLDVISLSLGGNGNPDDPQSKAVDNAVDAGVVAVVAAGNSGPSPNTIMSPGTARNAITIGATDKNDKIADFSSRGPVIWDNNYLVKPDIVAPGVNICAAEWDNAWSDRKCLDNSHIAISGTSMATPHVSGVAALIKQAHVTWYPNEIKMALRNTATDISSSIIAQGYGRIDALRVASLKNKPSLAILDTSGLIVGVVDVLGTATGENFNGYTLYYGSGIEPNDWTTLFSSSTQVTAGILYKGLDYGLLSEGENSLRLVVGNADGQSSEDRTIIIVNNVELTNPISNDIFRLGDNINITGTVRGAFKWYTIEYGKGGNPQEWFSEGVTLANEGKRQVTNGKIGVWDTSFIAKSGFYTLRLTLDYGTKKVYEYVKNIYIDSTLKKGWPKRINWEFIGSSTSTSFVTTAQFYTPLPLYLSQGNAEGKIETLTAKEFQQKVASSVKTNEGYYLWAGFLEPVVEDLNNDGLKEIIIYKGGNPPKILVYDQDGSLLWSINVGNGIVDGGNLHIPLVGDLNNDGLKEIIAYNIYDSKKSELYAELYAFDYSGNQLEGFPVLVPKDFHPTMLMADLNLDENKEVIIKGNDAIQQKMVIVNKYGNIISQFDLPKNSWGAGIVSLPAVGNFDNDNDLEIVVAQPSPKAGYDWERKEWINEGIITIYNIDGTQVTGWPVVVPGGPFSSPAIGDINNDGELEIVVGLLYESDIFPDIRYGGLYAFDKNGKILRGWPVGKGYNFWSSPSLADFDNDGKLEIAASILRFMTYVYHHDGSIADGWPRDTAWNDYYSTIISDVNGDGKPDVLTTAGSGFYYSTVYHGGVYAWNFYGPTIRGFPKVTEVDAQAPAIVEDIDNDGEVELLASSDWDLDITTNRIKGRGTLYVWDLESALNENTMHWPTFHHDMQRTGLYGYKPKEEGSGLVFAFRDVSGSNVASFYENGNIVLKGACKPSSICIPPSDSFSFVLQNTAGETVAYIDSNGNLCIESGACSDKSSSCNPSSSDPFVIKDKNNNNVAYIGNSGSLCLIGTLTRYGYP